MERRTFLKGILGAAATAFGPIPLLEALGNGPEPFARCLRTGDYVVTASCLVFVPETGYYVLRVIQNGERVVGLAQCTITPDLPVSVTIQLQMNLRRCQAGDQFSLEVCRNAVPYGDAKTEATLTIMEIDS